MSEKQCFKCNIVKPLNQFYKHKQMLDGHLNKCKDCTKSDVSKHRQENIDYIREYDRSRGNLPKRVAARNKYAKTEQGEQKLKEGKQRYAKSEHGKRKRSEATHRYRENNLVKRAAHIILGNSIRSGKIVKPNVCEVCEKTNVILHGHHDDYAKPLEIRWLCGKCHSKWHKENSAGLNG